MLWSERGNIPDSIFDHNPEISRGIMASDLICRNQLGEFHFALVMPDR